MFWKWNRVSYNSCIHKKGPFHIFFSFVPTILSPYTEESGVKFCLFIEIFFFSNFVMHTEKTKLKHTHRSS